MNPFSVACTAQKVIAYAAIAAAVAFAAAAIVQTVRLAGERRAHDELATEFATHKEDAERTARLASENYRREEQRRIQAQKEAEDEATRQLEAARADAGAAADALRRLRQRVAADAARRAAAGDPAAPQGGPAAEPAAHLPADALLARLGEAAGQLAAHADAARIAGLACERSYDALTRGAE
jgi:hypothetical protein